MALIKQETATAKKTEKTVALENETWKKINSYAKFAGFKGTAAEKTAFLIEAALNRVFEEDSEYQTYRKAAAEKAANARAARAAKAKKAE